MYFQDKFDILLLTLFLILNIMNSKNYYVGIDMKNYVHELQKKKWGVFHHYMSHCFLDPNSDRNIGKGVPTWNECVNMFDTDRLAYSLHKMGGFVTIDMFTHIDGSLDPEQEGFMRYVGNHL